MKRVLQREIYMIKTNKNNRHNNELALEHGFILTSICLRNIMNHT